MKKKTFIRLNLNVSILAQGLCFPRTFGAWKGSWLTH